MTMKPKRATLICMVRLLCLGLIFVCALFAQYDTATVLGSVMDSTGAIVPGAKVTLINTQTGVAVTQPVDESGNYQFLNLRIGTYKVQAEKTGFKIASSEAFTLTVNARQRVNLTMQVGDVTETVTVSEAAALVETDSSDRGQVINRAGDRQPAAERPRLRRSGAAVARACASPTSPTATRRST